MLHRDPPSGDGPAGVQVVERASVHCLRPGIGAKHGAAPGRCARHAPSATSVDRAAPPSPGPDGWRISILRTSAPRLATPAFGASVNEQRRTRMTRHRWLAPLAVLSLVVAACGGTTASTAPTGSSDGAAPQSAHHRARPASSRSPT